MSTVSVVIPVYNHERFIGRAIDSVLAQTYSDFELIVVDDGSTDGTADVLRSYGDRIVCITQANAGGAAALNRGIRESNGSWVAWLSSDDEWEGEKLDRQISAIKADPDLAAVFTDYKVIDSSGRTLSIVRYRLPSNRWRQRVEMLRWCFINGSTMLIRRSIFDEIGFFDVTDRWAPDYDMWIRILNRYRVAHVPLPLVRYREHPGQATANRERVELAGQVVFAKAARASPFRVVAPAFVLRCWDGVASAVRRVAGTRRERELRGQLWLLVRFLEALVAPERYSCD